MTAVQTWHHQRKNSWIEASGLSLPPEILSIISEYRIFVPTLQKVQAVFEQHETWLRLFTEVFQMAITDPISTYFDFPIIPAILPQSLPADVREHVGDIPFPGDMIDGAGQSHPIMRWEESGQPAIVVHLFKAATKLQHTHLCYVLSAAKGQLVWIETSEHRLFCSPNQVQLWFEKVAFHPHRSDMEVRYQSFLCPKNGYRSLLANTHRSTFSISTRTLEVDNSTEHNSDNDECTESKQKNKCVCMSPIQLTDRLVFTKKRKAVEEEI